MHGAAASYDRRNGVVRRRPGRMVVGQRSLGGTFQRRSRHRASEINQTTTFPLQDGATQSATTTVYVRCIRNLIYVQGCRRKNKATFYDNFEKRGSVSAVLFTRDSSYRCSASWPSQFCLSVRPSLGWISQKRCKLG